MRDSALKRLVRGGDALGVDTVGNELMRDSALKRKNAAINVVLMLQLEMSSCATAL